MKPRHGRTDANHRDAIRWFEELGCTVCDHSQVGDGEGDLTIGLVGIDQIVEVKTEDGDLQTSQINFNAKWRGRRPVVCRTQADAIKIVTDIRKSVRR